MRLALILTAGLLAGCADAATQPSQTYYVEGDARRLASCSYRHLIESGTPVRLTPLDDLDGAEVSLAMQVCGFVGCAGDRLTYRAIFQPSGPGQTAISFREHPTVRAPEHYWRTSMAPAVAACTRSTGQ